MATFKTATSVQVSSNVQLTYKELQAKLKQLRNNGHDVQCKLNGKHDVLVAEYNRIIRTIEQELQQVLSNSTDTTTPKPNDSYPFTSNTVQVYNTSTLLAMNAKLVPSWLARPQKVYIINGVDYLPYELEMQLQSMVADGTNSCELTCEWNAPAPIEQQSASVQCSTTDNSTMVQVSVQSPCLSKTTLTNTQCKGIQKHWESYIIQQDTTVQQAALNGMDILRCTKAFLKGFMTGLSATGRKQYRAAK